jgi:GTP-binding protein
MDARFVRSCPDPRCFPPPVLPELSVAGRSNCGKSSLINALTGRTKLARTSATPGRTQELVFFQLTIAGEEPFMLVDLPGYGYARVSKSVKRAWDELVTHYIATRSCLRALLMLCDARRCPAEEEANLLRWARDRGLGVHVILTKADKLKKSQRFAASAAAKEALGLARRPLLFTIRDQDAVLELRQAVTALMRSTAPA